MSLLEYYNERRFHFSLDMKARETLLKAFHSRITTKKRSKMDIIEDPIFKKSHLRNLVQLADMIAYVVHKHYRSDVQFENWFNGLKHKMYQPNGNLNGFGLHEFP